MAPLSSVKSVSAHIVLHTVGGCGFGMRDQLIVGVDRLRRLARADGDRRQRRDEAAAVEHAFDDRQHVGVHGDPLVQVAVHEQVVDPPGVLAFEAVRRRLDAEVVLEAHEVVGECVDQLGLDRAIEDREALLGDLGHVRGGVHGRSF